MIRTLRTRLVAAAMLSPAGGAHGDSGGHSPGQLPGDCLRRGPYFGPAGRGGGDLSLPCRRISTGRRRAPAAAPRSWGMRSVTSPSFWTRAATWPPPTWGRLPLWTRRRREAYAQQVRAQGHTRGFLQDYRYLTAQEGDQTRVIFWTTAATCSPSDPRCLQGFGCRRWGCWQCFSCCSSSPGGSSAPFWRAMKSKKRFITDAGHELKTPIAIIQADTDVLTLETGEGQ